ncbi:hypothetical protein B0A62_13180 [Flavobacterium hydatis]|uniref:Peptidase S9 prolyl oligopeptidase catalytic domain-containing protein n=2 Tax=Flavobacterium hydatis TaxID=991 RepID=A0A086AM56_FLAHY|nr:hypothetical protein IW20_07320 [Flavobacterium hydatis]OXA93694.1 hypothetical protein B0A62_13180 [Flavobacterium hydatis]
MQKKTLTVEDYPKWGQLIFDKMSENGQWVNYTMSYENGLDTLFVKNTKTLKAYAFPLADRGAFITSDWFIYQTTKKIHLVNLKTGKQETVLNATRYMYSSAAKQLLILTTEKGKGNTLIIREPDGTGEERLAGVDEFVMDPTKQIVLYTTTVGHKHSVCLLELLHENRKTLLHTGSNHFTNLVWHTKGKTLAFMECPSESSPKNTIFYYSLSDKKVYNSSPEIQQAFLGDSLFIPALPAINYKLKISDDMQKVFFTLKGIGKSRDTLKDSDVQLWNGNAKWIYPREEKKENQKEKTYLGLWDPLENHFLLISNDTLSEFMLTGDQKYAVLSNKRQYEPQYDYDGPRDYYLVDLSTSKSELLLKKHSGSNRRTIVSPTGKYISYFKQGNWWIYDIIKKTHTNITKNIGQSFLNNEGEYSNEGLYSTIGWTPRDNEILLFDKYDLWTIKPDGSSARRLTHGRETQTSFRLAGYSNRPTTEINYNGRIHEIIDLNKGLLLESTNEQKHSGYYRWTTKSIEKIVYSTNSQLNQLTLSTKNDVFVYSEQRYNLPPRLMMETRADKTPKVIVQSNPQHQHFNWGKAELITYKNAKGQSLQAILYYPAEYTNKKKYPMIVNIYEKFSDRLHRYINPSQFKDVGFNISTFTSQGYFVLLPDISYEIGNVGLSAADCVISATNEVIVQGHVLPNKIGLIGHSFGGYETDFIITQTKLFTAAVAGAAATDLTSYYLTVGNTGRPEMWRFENQQWRMGKSLFEDKVGYDRNSPIVHVNNITTPLLSWTGGDDRQVNWNQSIEFYLALWRLKKQHIMLLYPKEEHTLSERKNQKDLSIRLHEWFDYYLKDMPPALWIKVGLK